MQLLDTLLGILGHRLAAGEQLRSMLEQLLFPGGDLRRMHLVLLGQFRKRLVTANSLQSDLRFESRRTVTTDRFMVTAPLKG